MEMNLGLSERVAKLRDRVSEIIRNDIMPLEAEYHAEVSKGDRWTLTDRQVEIMTGLKDKVRAEGLWNFWLTGSDKGFGLTTVEYAYMAEELGKSPLAAEVFNCSAPDTGNMEVFERYGTEEMKTRWLAPLLAGEIRSAYVMTEPDVASSDATNIGLPITRDGDQFVLNGRKWWTTGAINPRCKIMLVMGKSNPENERHRQHSTILVPRDTPGVKLVRELRVFDNLHSPGGEAEFFFDNVRVPVSNMIKGEGCGFEIAQGRLGPGRFQYAMGLVGLAQRCLELMCARAEERVAFGEKLIKKTSVQHEIARCRCDIVQARLLTMEAAHVMDTQGMKAAIPYISMVKIVAPNMAQNVADRAMQVFGGAGVCQDTLIPEVFTLARFSRIADGPDEVHMSQLGKMTARELNS